jgi:hypothetical protein
MRRAASTGVAGLGLTFASTFASSLGLSLTQERIGFCAGVLLALGSAVVIIWDVWRKPNDPNDALAYINGRLELGNRLLGFWPEHSQGHEMIETVCAWELETYRGLGEKLPHKQAYFRVDGLDREYPDEPHIRLMLRQRIRRLSEIAGRL